MQYIVIAIPLLAIVAQNIVPVLVLDNKDVDVDDDVDDDDDDDVDDDVVDGDVNGDGDK